MAAATEGYKALREGAGLLDLTGRGLIALSGEDQVRLLHAMCTNHIEELRPGEGCYAFLLSAQGRILSDCNVLAGDETLILDTEPEARQAVAGHLEKYIIADDCTVQDLTDSRCVFGVEGPLAERMLQDVTTSALPEPGNWIAWQNGSIAALSVTGQPGYRIFADRNQAGGVEGWLMGTGAIPVTPEEIASVRIENARPKFGEDFGPANIVHETQLLRAVHFSKGCYLGQEIVERVRSRGQVNRKLVQFTVDSAEPPAAGTKILVEGKDVGEITSSAFSPASGKSVAMGYLRTEVVERKIAVRAGAMLARATDRIPA